MHILSRSMLYQRLAASFAFSADIIQVSLIAFLSGFSPLSACDCDKQHLQILHFEVVTEWARIYKWERRIRGERDIS